DSIRARRMGPADTRASSGAAKKAVPPRQSAPAPTLLALSTQQQHHGSGPAGAAAGGEVLERAKVGAGPGGVACSEEGSRPEACTTMPRAVGIVRLGCPKKLVDSEKMLGLLAREGVRPVAYVAENPGSFGGADGVVVNTCGFLEAS